MIQFKINGIDISNDVILNSFTYMQRIDEVYGTGSFQFESKTITENIPPYSVLEINGTYYCCSSEATYHFGTDSWFHNVSIIEATSLLSRFLVGSKAFSITGTNTFDYAKIFILMNLINQKYDVKIEFEGDLVNTFTKEIEYVFGAGTTLFDALNEFAKQYNVRFYVSTIDGNNIRVKYTDLTNLDIFNYKQSNVLSLTKIQNAETYCKYLESEAKNVIDTNQTTLVKNVFPTANEIKLSEDTFKIELPTSIYEIVSFKTKYVGYLRTIIQTYMIESGQRTYGEWAERYPFLKDVFDKYYSEFFDWDYFKQRIWKKEYGNFFPIADGDNLAQKIRIVDAVLDLTSHIVPKEQYDLIEDKNKPDYAYYTMGSNVIDGLSINYKTDFWNTIIGESKDAFLLRDLTDKKYEGVYYIGDENSGDYLLIEIWEATYEHNLFETTYDIEYKPMANPYMVESKIDTPNNEETYKPYSLSYGKSSNYVDFDKFETSMRIENKSIGRTEMVLEYDTTTYNLGYPFDKKILIDNKNWYIISSETTFNGYQQISKFNLVSNFDKIADVVSLNSQYNTLENPLQNIIERPIYVESDIDVIYTQGKTHVMLLINSDTDNEIKIVKPAVIFKNENDTYLYVEMIDQFSAGKNYTRVYVTGNVDELLFKVNDVAYVDNNNELYDVFINLIDIDNVTLEQAKQMPEYNGTYTNQKVISYRKVFKDAREKLTFTIKLNNCIIK